MENNNGRYFWVSQDSQIITTYHGKIIEAVGLVTILKSLLLQMIFLKNLNFLQN